ncbi:unnamed protein product [Lactuca virosa]|uniref:Cyclin-like domain-containing protein n=1 Tax=Lactuca virosa TaxID=75947 RepID=A0AAU9MGU3_9ASTR|nr:unnamed protein product [Lactuca virosa]
MEAPMQCYISQKEIVKEHISEAPHLNRNWYFSRKEIEHHTPSRSDGIDYKHEQHLRKLYCSFLQELGIELKVPQVTIATAMMFCHRFYMRHSHEKNDWQTVATVCMFLACKAEETPRWLGELAVVAYKLIYKWDPSASRRIREIYDKQKDLILIGERLLLITIAFDLNIEHPYKSLVAALKRLSITDKELVKVAWNFVNDWLRTSLCLQHKPHYIAAGSLFLAAKVKKVKLPTAKGKAWWMEFDVSPKQLEGVIQQMMSLWEQSQSQTVTLSGSEISKSTTYSPESATKSNYVKKQVFEDSYDTINCVDKTSDTGSGVSVVEDGEPVAIKSDLSSGCKIGGNNSQVDVDRIREKIKKRNSIKTMKRKCVEEDMDGDEWIERELEDGIVLESPIPGN